MRCRIEGLRFVEGATPTCLKPSSRIPNPEPNVRAYSLNPEICGLGDLTV